MQRDFVTENPLNCVVKMQVKATDKMLRQRLSNVGSDYNQRTVTLGSTKSPQRRVATNPSQPRLRDIYE